MEVYEIKRVIAQKCLNNHRFILFVNKIGTVEEMVDWLDSHLIFHDEYFYFFDVVPVQTEIVFNPIPGVWENVVWRTIHREAYDGFWDINQTNRLSWYDSI